MKTCYQCGTSLDDAAVFCTNCGAPMGNQPQNSGAPQGPAEEQITPASSLLENTPTPEPTPVVSTPPVSQPAKKTDKNLAMIVGMVACALIGVAGLTFGIMKSSQKPAAPATPNTSSEESPEEEAPVSGTKVAFGKVWQATVPDDMAFETDDDELIIGDTSGSQWVAYIDYDSSAAFSNISGNFSAFGDYLTSHGYRDVKTGNNTINDVEFYWADLVDPDSDLPVTVAFAAAPDLYSFQITAATSTSDPDHAVLEKVATVLTSVEKVSKSLRSGNGTDPLAVPTIEYKW